MYDTMYRAYRLTANGGVDTSEAIHVNGDLAWLVRMAVQWGCAVSCVADFSDF